MKAKVHFGTKYVPEGLKDSGDTDIVLQMLHQRPHSQSLSTQTVVQPLQK